jgi:hypothetical protein
MRMRCSILSVRLYHIFYIIPQMARISEKKLLIIKYVFWFSVEDLSEIFLILKRIQ